MSGKFTLNREYLVRHAGVALLMAALCCWFSYDAAVAYPKMDAVEFCEKYHKRLDNPEREKSTAIARQWQFASISLIASLAILCHLLKVRGETLEWDDEKMTGSLVSGAEALFRDVKKTDRSQWEKKRIFRIEMEDGRKIVLDAWHHPEAADLVAAKFLP